MSTSLSPPATSSTLTGTSHQTWTYVQPGPVGTTTTTTSFAANATSPAIVSELIFVNITADCRWWFEFGRVLAPNADVSGLGVITAYSASAYIVLFWAAFCYFAGMLPPELLSRADRKYLRTNSRRANNRWSTLSRRVTLILSDQQIITGIGILLAGYVNLKSELSAYHWQILVYLAWMSSNVHLTTLTLLRGWLQEKSSLRQWRIMGMLLLMVMLLAALVPMTTNAWAIAALGNYPVKISHDHLDYGNEQYSGFGIPARCFWPLAVQFVGRSTSADACISYVIIICSYFWKVSQLYGQGTSRVNDWLRNTPTRFLVATATKQLIKAKRGTFGAKAAYRITMLWLIPLLALYEFMDSFIASLWILTFGLIWASVRVFSPRHYVNHSVLQQENQWGIGQILPLMLLLLPAAAILEESHDYQHEEKITCIHDPNLSSLVARGDSAMASASQTDMEAVERPKQDVKYLSQLLVAEDAQLSYTSAAQEVDMDAVMEYLYSRRLFGVVFVFINIGALATVITISWTSVYAGWTWYYGLIAGGASAGWVCVVLVPVGSFFSRIFK